MLLAVLIHAVSEPAVLPPGKAHPKKPINARKCLLPKYDPLAVKFFWADTEKIEL